MNLSSIHLHSSDREAVPSMQGFIYVFSPLPVASPPIIVYFIPCVHMSSHMSSVSTEYSSYKYIHHSFKAQKDIVWLKGDD